MGRPAGRAMRWRLHKPEGMPGRRDGSSQERLRTMGSSVLGLLKGCRPVSSTYISTPRPHLRSGGGSDHCLLSGGSSCAAAAPDPQQPWPQQTAGRGSGVAAPLGRSSNKPSLPFFSFCRLHLQTDCPACLQTQNSPCLHHSLDHHAPVHRKVISVGEHVFGGHVARRAAEGVRLAPVLQHLGGRAMRGRSCMWGWGQ